MKRSKLWCLLLLICFCCSFSGCTTKEVDAVDSVKHEVSSTSQVDSGVDVDLTKMSGTMVYSEVFHIMTNPEDYIGKTIRIRGQYSANYYEQTGKYYHSVIIKDATACCAQGIEFLWDQDSHVYPDEYPSEGAEIEIAGLFELYTEEGSENTYARLVTDEVQRLS